MRIIIADDEKLIRHSIRCNCLQLGFEEQDVDEAENGEVLLNKLRTTHYDLALVDVKMPLMNGLEAIRNGIIIAPDTLFYILSGYDEFKYAQEAIRMGVRDYLLKPVSKNDLDKIIEDSVLLIEQKRSDFRRNLKMLIGEMLEEPRENIQFPITGRAYFIMHDSMNMEPVLTNELFGLTRSLFFIERKDPAGKGTIVFLFQEPGEEGVYSDFVNRLVKYLIKSSTVYESKEFLDSETFLAEYQRISALASQRVYTGLRRFYKKGILGLKIPEDLSKISETVILLFESYRGKDYSRFIQYSKQLSSMEKNLQHHCSYKEKFYKSVGQLFDISKEQYILEIEMEKRAKELILSTEKGRDNLAENALIYMNNHYNEDISINSMAALYSITPNYFSTIFHKETGKSFIQYLTDIRIQEGKRFLMETNLSVNEITRRIGYYSSSYFIKRFAQSEGMTPAEFRTQNNL